MQQAPHLGRSHIDGGRVLQLLGCQVAVAFAVAAWWWLTYRILNTSTILGTNTPATTTAGPTAGGLGFAAKDSEETNRSGEIYEEMINWICVEGENCSNNIIVTIQICLLLYIPV